MNTQNDVECSGQEDAQKNQKEEWRIKFKDNEATVQSKKDLCIGASLILQKNDPLKKNMLLLDKRISDTFLYC